MNNEVLINVPLEFQKLNSLPEDPANSVSYGKQTQSSSCFTMIYPIPNANAMPYGDDRTVINGIHGALGVGQGLVEVKSGVTKNQKRYIYSIVKSKLDPSGMQYILTMHIDMTDHAINVKAYFNEAGVTGSRDATIMNKMISEGKISLPNMDGWFKDPYDENFKSGLLMNQSELEEYDAAFPQHPLSEERNFVKYIIENN